MKRLAFILAICFALISACIIYLLKSGISIRSAPLIRPSLMTGDLRHVARAVILRLSPELQNARYVLWGVPSTSESQHLIELLRAEAEELHQKPVDLVATAEAMTTAELKRCKKPCWLLLPAESANELKLNSFIASKLPSEQGEKSNHINITLLPFTRGGEAPESCVAQKRLTLDCLKILAVHESQRKMRSAELHFFLRRYLDRDYFLFTESRSH